MLARYGVMVKVRQAALNPKGKTEAGPCWGRAGQGGHQSGVSMESVFVMGTDCSGEMRADSVTPKHRQAVHARGRGRRWGMYVTGARVRSGHGVRP